MKRKHVSVALDEPAPDRQAAFEFPPWKEELRLQSARPAKIPGSFPSVWDGIMAARAAMEAPVDKWGCERLYDPAASPAHQRFHMLVSLMLSPQSKDEKTAEAMRNLWQNGPLTPERIAAMAPEALEELIKPAGLYRAKAKALIEASATLVAKHDSDVPKTMAGLMELRGVGPKIASLALSCCWRMDTAIGCDTHVTRICQRLGFVPGGHEAKKNAEFVRKELEEWLPKALWRPINYSLVGFGQTICTARNPKCAECPVNTFCPSAAFFTKKQK